MRIVADKVKWMDSRVCCPHANLRNIAGVMQGWSKNSYATTDS